MMVYLGKNVLGVSRLNVYSLTVPETVTYNNVSYTVLDVLDKCLLLVVETEKLKNKDFPLNTLVIPNE